MTATPETLPRRVRIGYGAGSVATGAFGTVPGLMLLPYLTDSLGIAALAAGVIVVAPKAWDVLLNPVAGRISDRSTDPRGPRRPFLLRAGLTLGVCFALLFASPGLGSQGAEAAWVLVAFLACATAYAFFQVPYVAMPAEITDSYAERTRLMTWRVAILALTIMVAGASAPLIRDAVGGRDGYRAMGLAMAAVILVGVVAAYRGTRDAPVRAVAAGPGSLRDQLRIVAGAPDFRLLLTTFVLQALATGCMLAGVDYLAGDVLGRSGAATILFVCFVGPALLLTPLWSALGPADRQEARLRRLVARARRWALRSPPPPARPPTAWSSPPSPSSGSGTPAARCSRWRCCPTPPPSTPGAPARTGPASTPASGPPARPSGWPSGPGVFALVLAFGSYRSGTDRRPRPARLGADRDHPRLLAAARRAGAAQPLVAAALHARRATRVDAPSTTKET